MRKKELKEKKKGGRRDKEGREKGEWEGEEIEGNGIKRKTRRTGRKGGRVKKRKVGSYKDRVKVQCGTKLYKYKNSTKFSK